MGDVLPILSSELAPVKSVFISNLTFGFLLQATLLWQDNDNP